MKMTVTETISITDRDKVLCTVKVTTIVAVIIIAVTTSTTVEFRAVPSGKGGGGQGGSYPPSGDLTK